MPARSDHRFAGCPLPFPTDLWRAEVLRAKDGDSLVINYDRGFFDTSLKGDRFASIDVYERFTGIEPDRALGRAAWDFVVARAVGRWCYIHTMMDREKYGRILEDVYYLGADGDIHDLSLELHHAGYRKPGTRFRNEHYRQTDRCRKLAGLRPGGMVMLERNTDIYERVQAGETMTAVAEQYGISAPRVRQIVEKMKLHLQETRIPEQP